MHTKWCFCIFFFVIRLKKVWKLGYLVFFTRTDMREFVLDKSFARISFRQSCWNSRIFLRLRYVTPNGKVTKCFINISLDIHVLRPFEESTNALGIICCGFVTFKYRFDSPQVKRYLISDIKTLYTSYQTIFKWLKNDLETTYFPKELEI